MKSDNHKSDHEWFEEIRRELFGPADLIPEHLQSLEAFESAMDALPPDEVKPMTEAEVDLLISQATARQRRVEEPFVIKADLPSRLAAAADDDGEESMFTSDPSSILLAEKTNGDQPLPESQDSRETHLTRWVNAQQIGMLAHWLREYSTINYTRIDSSQRQIAKDCRNRLKAKLLQRLNAHGRSPEQLRTLPPATLYLLRQLAAEDIDSCNDLYGAIPEIIAHVVESPTGSVSRAKAFVHHLLNASGDPARVLGFGNAIMRRKGRSHLHGKGRTRWQDISESKHGFLVFSELVKELRSPQLGTRAAVSTVSKLAAILDRPPHAPGEASQIINLLFDGLFAWPLLVIPAGTVPLGLSLPIGVDVQIPSLPETFDPRTRMFAKRPQIVGGTLFERRTKDREGRNWDDYQALAVKIGRDLWLGSHGQFGDYRRRIRCARVQFDFSIADRIISPTVDAMGWPCMPLQDGSAVPYFAQIVLSRLLGRRWHHPSAVTGVATPERVTDGLGNQLLDYDFRLKVGGLWKKLQYAFASRRFERIIVPSNNEIRDSIERFFMRRQRAIGGSNNVIPQACEIVAAFRQSNVADIFQTDGWRRWTYVRLPSVRWAIHGDNKPGLLPPSDVGVASVLKSLQGAKDKIVELRHTRPIAVASALNYVNSNVVRCIVPTIPPALSWAFIKFVKEEGYSSFWHVVWRALGATEAARDRFLNSPTSSCAAKELAIALSSYELKDTSPSHRPPDVLVVVGLQDILDDGRRQSGSVANPLCVWWIFQQLRCDESLKPSPDRRKHVELEAALGSVRVVLVNDINEGLEVRGGNFRLSAGDIQLLQPLSAFRFGFRQQMASAVLQKCSLLKGHNIRPALENLVKSGFLHTHGGEYFMDEPLRLHMLSAMTESELARLHLVAGGATAPYAVGSAAPSLPFDLAARPEVLHEASFHFRSAFRLFDLLEAKQSLPRLSPTARERVSEERRGKDDARTALYRLVRFAALSSWDTVTELLRAKQIGAAAEAYRMARTLISDSEADWPALLRPTRPLEILQQTRALIQWRPEDEGGITAHFLEAVEECERLVDGREQCLLTVLPNYSNYLHGKGCYTESLSIDQRILSLRTHWKNLPGEWFERRGDETDDDSAVAEYGNGLLFAPAARQLPFKLLGAALHANGQIEMKLTEWIQGNEDEMMFSIVKARNAIRRDIRRYQSTGVATVVNRWKTALMEIARIRAGSEVADLARRTLFAIQQASARH